MSARTTAVTARRLVHLQSTGRARSQRESSGSGLVASFGTSFKTLAADRLVPVSGGFLGGSDDTPGS